MRQSAEQSSQGSSMTPLPSFVSASVCLCVEWSGVEVQDPPLVHHFTLARGPSWREPTPSRAAAFVCVSVETRGAHPGMLSC